nr:DUF6767 domain-containing protein [Micromonospora sp. DSM 115978]
MTARPARRPEPKCPIRPGEPCTLCLPGATGPQDCGLVYLVMSDDELRTGLRRTREGSGSAG